MIVRLPKAHDIKPEYHRHRLTRLWPYAPAAQPGAAAVRQASSARLRYASISNRERAEGRIWVKVRPSAPLGFASGMRR